MGSMMHVKGPRKKFAKSKFYYKQQSLRAATLLFKFDHCIIADSLIPDCNNLKCMSKFEAPPVPFRLLYLTFV